MTGYTRADSVNNIADGNIINASDLDGEFDAVQAAFNSSTGHVHDGTAANGAPITKIGPTQDVVASATALTPKTTATVDVGSSSLKFKDFFYSGAGSVTGIITAGGFAGPLNGTVGATTPAAGTFTAVTNSALTSGRVVYSTTGGLETDSANLTFSGTILTSTGFSGPLNGTVGATTPSTGAFTTVSASSRVNTDTLNNAANSASIILRTGATTVVGNSASALVVTDAANVGIGTSSPNLSSSSTALTVNTGTAANFAAFELASAGTLNYHINANNAAVYHVAAGARPWIVFTNGSERMRIDSSGNVGIGTSSPSTKLAVAGTILGSANIYCGDGSAYVFGGSGTAYIGGSSTSNFITFNTASTERMRIDSSGNVLVGTSVNSVYDGVAQPRPLVVQSSSATTTQYNSTNAIVICNSDTTTNNASQLNFAAITGASTNQYTSAVISCIYGARTNTVYPSGILTFATSPVTQAPVERMRIDSSGNLLVATNTLRTNYSSGAQTPVFQIEKAADVRASITRDTNDSSGAVIYFGKTRGTTVNSNTVVADGDNLGLLAFEGADGTNLIRAASISAQVDGAPGANDMPGRLLFNTTADGGTTAVERMRINSSGDVLVTGTGTGSLGYGTGSGGTVTQATSKSTTVTLNKPTGQITMNNAALLPATQVGFVCNNSLVSASDLIVINAGASFVGNYSVRACGNAGNFIIYVQNETAGSLSEAVTLNFAIIKGATS